MVAEHNAPASKEAIRQRVWSELRQVARPDSRFHWDFAEFIADYEGSEVGAHDSLRALAQLTAPTRPLVTSI